MSGHHYMSAVSGARRIGMLLGAMVAMVSTMLLGGCQIASQWVFEPPPLIYVAGWDGTMAVPGSGVTYVVKTEGSREVDGVVYMISDYGNAPARHRIYPICGGKCVIDETVERRWVAGTHFSPGVLRNYHIGLSLRNPQSSSLFVVVKGYVPTGGEPIEVLMDGGNPGNGDELVVTMVPASPKEEREWLRQVLWGTTVRGLEVGRDRKIAVEMRHRLWDRWAEIVGQTGDSPQE
jgi:hypothetical protein